MLRRLLSLDYVLEHPELPWLPTEQEKVAFFDLLGFDRRRLPSRLYHGANGNQTRYFALKLSIAADTKTATFAYVDPGRYTDTELGHSCSASSDPVSRHSRLFPVILLDQRDAGCGSVRSSPNTSTRIRSWCSRSSARAFSRRTPTTSENGSRFLLSGCTQ